MWSIALFLESKKCPVGARKCDFLISLEPTLVSTVRIFQPAGRLARPLTQRGSFRSTTSADCAEAGDTAASSARLSTEATEARSSDTAPTLNTGPATAAVSRLRPFQSEDSIWLRIPSQNSLSSSWKVRETVAEDCPDPVKNCALAAWLPGPGAAAGRAMVCGLLGPGPGSRLELGIRWKVCASEEESVTASW